MAASFVPDQRSVSGVFGISGQRQFQPISDFRSGGMVGTTMKLFTSAGFNRKASGYLSGLVFSSGSVLRQA